MPGSLLRKSRPREPLHIAILSFNRPRYLQQVLKSLRRQVSEQDEIVLMQDGAVNTWSGLVKSSAADVQACVSLFRRMIPWGKILESPTNISIALNYERAEKYLFETKQRPHACILEDDLVLSPRYLEVLTALLSIAKADPRIAYVSACGNMWAQLDEQRRCAAELSHMHENWGFAMTREAWLDERPFRAKYLRLLEDRDYSQRDHAGIVAFYRMRGWTTQITSQDAARWIACIELGKVRLTTFACHARNIGRTGEHFTPEIYDRGGFGGTVMYRATLPRLSPPTAAQIDQWLDVERKRFSDVARVAFYEGHGVRMA